MTKIGRGPEFPAELKCSQGANNHREEDNSTGGTPKGDTDDQLYGPPNGETRREESNEAVGTSMGDTTPELPSGTLESETRAGASARSEDQEEDGTHHSTTLHKGDTVTPKCRPKERGTSNGETSRVEVRNSKGKSIITNKKKSRRMLYLTSSSKSEWGDMEGSDEDWSASKESEAHSQEIGDEEMARSKSKRPSGLRSKKKGGVGKMAKDKGEAHMEQGSAIRKRRSTIESGNREESPKEVDESAEGKG